MSRSSSKGKLAKLDEQRREREARAEIVPQEKPPRATSSTTSYLLPTTLLDDLQKTKLSLQLETGDRRGYNASTIVRAALQHFVQLEMDDQIAMVTRHVQADAKASE